MRLKQGKGQPIRSDGPQSHLLTKKGTPTMGGLMILSGLFVSTLLWANLRNGYVWVVLLVTLGFGLIGFYDDYLKVTKQSHKGFSGKARLALEALIAGLACYALTKLGATPAATSLAVPFVNGFVTDLGLFIIVFGAFVIVAAGNAVNLTDGLDGLAIVPVMIASGTFAMISYLVGNAIYSAYLGVNFVPGTGELAVVLGAVIAGLPLPLLPLQLLWVNLVTDGLPALALVMDPPTDDVLQRPPRSPDEPLLGRQQWLVVIATGLLQTAVTLGVYWWALRYRNMAEARNLAFSALVFGEVLRAFAARSDTRVHWELGLLSNWRLVLVAVATVSAQLAIHHLPAAQELFSIGPLSLPDCGLSLLLGLLPVTVLELWKLARRSPTLLPRPMHEAAGGAPLAAPANETHEEEATR